VPFSLQYFMEASKEFNVPVELLESIAYAETRWRSHVPKGTHEERRTRDRGRARPAPRSKDAANALAADRESVTAARSRAPVVKTAGITIGSASESC